MCLRSLGLIWRPCFRTVESTSTTVSPIDILWDYAKASSGSDSCYQYIFICTENYLSHWLCALFIGLASGKHYSRFHKLAISTLHSRHVSCSKLHLGHVIDGASRVKTIDFLAGEHRFELMLEPMKSRHSQRIFRTKKRTFDLTVEVFVCSKSIVLRTKLLSYDLTAFWCVLLPSRDAKSMLNVSTFLKTAVRRRQLATTKTKRF